MANAQAGGTRLRIMEWNIWKGGREAGGAENVARLIELMRLQDADVLFILETYGSGQLILDGLNREAPADRRYAGVRITERPQPDRDNLWIFTRLPVVHRFPPVAGDGVDSFNFGGITVSLPGGRNLHLFNTWLWHAPWAWGRTDQTVKEIQQGAARTYTDAEIVATDHERRLPQARVILEERLPRFVGGDPSPVIVAGDLNTLPRADWTAEFAQAPGHAGLVLDWPVTRLFEEAGFVDVYRAVHPDAGRFPGTTWSPIFPGVAPGRIDYVWARGDGIVPVGAWVLDKRLPGHEHPEYPFYSDHAALVVELEIYAG